MTMWERARSVKHCGLCGGAIEVGQPVFLIRFDVPKRMDRMRCEKCAGPAPQDLPDLRTQRESPPRLSFGHTAHQSTLAGFTPELDDEG